MKTIGKITTKLYKCTRCGLEQKHSTNHWGDIYPTCKGCSWKNPMQPTITMICLESVPEGYKKPVPWKQVKLGDVCTIKSYNDTFTSTSEMDAPNTK